MTTLPNDNKKFRFISGEVLPAIRKVTFPGRLANQTVMFSAHIVDRDIPILWSRPGMTRAGVVLNMNENGA